MLITLTTKKNICKILLSSTLVFSSVYAYSGGKNDWILVEDSDRNISYFELKNDESVRYVVDANDFELKYLDSEFQSIAPIEIGSVLKIEDLSLYGKVKKKISADGTIGICFSRQASTPFGSKNFYNNYIHLIGNGGDGLRVTYVFLSNTPCSRNFDAKGKFFASSRIEIDQSSSHTGKSYEIKINTEKVVSFLKGNIRLGIDSRYLELKGN